MLLANFTLKKMKPSGLADLAASSALDAAAHSQLLPGDIRLESAASSTIDQLRLKTTSG